MHYIVKNNAYYSFLEAATKDDAHVRRMFDQSERLRNEQMVYFRIPFEWQIIPILSRDSRTISTQRNAPHLWIRNI